MVRSGRRHDRDRHPERDARHVERLGPRQPHGERHALPSGGRFGRDLLRHARPVVVPRRPGTSAQRRDRGRDSRVNRRVLLVGLRRAPVLDRDGDHG